MMPVVARFGELSSAGRTLARWSARALAASFLLAGLPSGARTAGNLFDSLANELRDAAICASRTPRWLSIAALLVAFRLIVGALWSAVGQQLLGSPKNTLDFHRLLRTNRMVIHAIWRAPDFRWLRRGLIWGAFIFAILSGLASTAFTAWILMAAGTSPSLLLWVLIVVVSFAISKGESLVTERLYARHALKPVPPTRQEAIARLAGYLDDHPGEARTASPVLYAYSALERDELGQRFAELGVTSAAARAHRIVSVVLVAALYPYVPAANVEHLGQRGFVGCLYSDFYGFFTVAAENLPLAAALAVALVVVSPLAVLWAYVKFMKEWRFPIDVQLVVLRRESGFALRMAGYMTVLAVASALVGMLLLWVSAELATRLDSPAAGLTVVVLATLAGIALYRRLTRASER